MRFEPEFSTNVDFEQDTSASLEYRLILRKPWLRPNMTEKLLTGTLNLNANKLIATLFVDLYENI